MYESEIMERVAQVVEERHQFGIECSEEEIARLWYQVALELDDERDRLLDLEVGSSRDQTPFQVPSVLLFLAPFRRVRNRQP